MGHRNDLMMFLTITGLLHRNCHTCCINFPHKLTHWSYLRAGSRYMTAYGIRDLGKYREVGITIWHSFDKRHIFVSPYGVSLIWIKVKGCLCLTVLFGFHLISEFRSRHNVEGMQIDYTVLSCKCQCNGMLILHDDVIKWKHFPRYWPFVRGIHHLLVNSPHKGQWRGALMFSLICVRKNDWVNNREAGDLRRYRAHYDVIVMGHTGTNAQPCEDIRSSGNWCQYCWPPN